MKITNSNKGGFTLVELMIIVAIIGLVASIAIPNFVRARTFSRQNTCIANLRQIENAKLVWANEENKVGADVPTEAELFGETKYLRAKPVCPSLGEYTLTQVDIPVKCSRAVDEGHKLEGHKP